jgi:hypothetical protein
MNLNSLDSSLQNSTMMNREPPDESDLQQELHQVRQESLKQLESAWAQIERLESEGFDADLRVNELEQRLQELRSNKKQSSGTHDARRNMQKSMSERRFQGWSDDDDDKIDDDDDESWTDSSDGAEQAPMRVGLLRSVVRRMSGSPSKNGSCPGFGRCRSDSDLKSLSAAGRSANAPWKNSTSPDDGLPDDPRIQLLLEDRRSALQQIRNESERKTIALETLQRTVVIQQEIIQELQEELEDHETPNRLAQLQDAVAAEEKRVEELEKQLKMEASLLTPLQQQHRTLQSEWFEGIDCLADVEGQSTEFLEAFQEKMQHITGEIETKEVHRLQLERQASEALVKIRQDMLKRYPQRETHTLMNDVDQQFSVVRQKERELADVLSKRLKERNRLTGAMQAISDTRKEAQDTADQLHAESGEEPVLVPIQQHERIAEALPGLLDSFVAAHASYNVPDIDAPDEIFLDHYCRNVDADAQVAAIANSEALLHETYAEALAALQQQNRPRDHSGG